MSYPNTQLFIDGQWRDAADGKSLGVFNPSTGQEIGRVAHANKADMDAALASAQKGFEVWRDIPAIERARTMRRAGAVHGFGLRRVGQWRTMAVEIAMPVSAHPVMASGIRVGSRIRRPLAHAFLLRAQQFLEMRSRDFGADRADIG